MSINELLKIKDKEAVKKKIIDFISESVRNREKNGAVFGISGGVDSALVAYLACEALGKEKVLALFMPERDSDPMNRNHAYLVADTLGINLIEINLTPILRKIGAYKLVPSPLFFPKSFQERYVLNKYRQIQDEKETAFLKSQKGGEGIPLLMRGNAFLRAKHRLRMVMWYVEGEKRNYLVLGCCNKTEKLIGYFVKYGDSGSDIDPVGDLYKTQVKELAEYVGVPREILEKPPSPDLMPGMTDEFALQMPYWKIDVILCAIENNMEKELIKEGITEKDIQYIRTLHNISEYLRRAPDYPRIY